MIRNYYTEAFKGGVVPVVSATQLIDGTVKITESFVVAAHPLNAATSTTIILVGLLPLVRKGMYITAPAAGGTPAWTINDHIMVEAVVYDSVSAPNTTTITISKPKAIGVNTGMTFFSIAQSSWTEYSLYIGTSLTQPDVNGIITSAIAGAAAGAQNTITTQQQNAYVKAGMLVYDDGVLIGTIATVTNASTYVLVNPLGQAVVVDSVLTFRLNLLPSITVLTIANQTMTFTNPAQGFVLPVSVVQVTSVTTGIGNLIALN